MRYHAIIAALSLALAPSAARTQTPPAPGAPGAADRSARGRQTDEQSGISAERQVICRGAAVPAGWVLVNDIRDRTTCGGSNPAVLNAYNVWVIERYVERPVDSVIDVCAGVPTPAGWVLVDVYRSRDMCGHPTGPFDVNVKRIRRTR